MLLSKQAVQVVSTNSYFHHITRQEFGQNGQRIDHALISLLQTIHFMSNIYHICQGKNNTGDKSHSNFIIAILYTQQVNTMTFIQCTSRTPKFVAKISCRKVELIRPFPPITIDTLSCDFHWRTAGHPII
jgi:hypothetical protein